MSTIFLGRALRPRPPAPHAGSSSRPAPRRPRRGLGVARLNLLALLTVLLGTTFGGLAGASTASAKSNAVVSRADGALDIFRRDPASGQLQTNSWNKNSGWTGWVGLGGGLSPDTDIAAVSRGAGSIDVFIRGTDDGVYQKSWDSGSGWGAWVSLGGIITGGPTAVSWDSGRVDVFVRGTQATLMQKSWLSSSGWTGWVDLGGGIKAGTGPAATSRVSGDLDVAVTGTDGALYVKSFQSGYGWYPWYTKGGVLLGGPGVASQRGARANREDFLGIATSGAVAQMTYINGGWVGWTDLGGQVPANNAPSAVWWNDGTQQRYDVFVTNIYGSVSQRTWTAAGWGSWTAPPDGPTPAPFLASGSCNANPSGWASGSVLGISLGRWPSKITSPGNADDTVQANAYTNVADCLRKVAGGRSPALRIQVPIDGMRQGSGAQIDAFAALLNRQGGTSAPAIVSIMSHDYSACSYAQPVAGLAAGAVLGSCQYPNPTLYKQLFQEVANKVAQATGRNDVLFSAWNEPDISKFTLGSDPNGAKIAGTLYAQAVSVVGLNRVLAGEFTNENATTVSNLKSAFVEGAGQTPAAWAYHPYGDMTSAATPADVNQLFPATNSFESLVGGSVRPVWLTEVGPQLYAAGAYRAANGDPNRQFNEGDALRRRLAAKPTRALLYHLTSAGDNSWDSGLTDRLGRARPVICGLASLPQSSCAGNTNAFN